VFKLKGYLSAYKKELVFGPLAKLLEAIFELLLPTIMAAMIDRGVGLHDRAYVLKSGGLMVAMALLGFASALVCQYLASRTSQGFGTALRNDLFSHVTSLSLERLDAYGTQTLTNRLTSDVNNLQTAVAMLIRLVIRAPFIFIGAMVMAMSLNLRLSLVILATAPLLTLVIVLVTKASAPLYAAYQRKLDGLSVVTRDNLSGVRVIRAFARRRDEERRFGAVNEDLTGTALSVGRISALLNPLTSLLVNAAILAILLWGGRMVGEGSLMKGEIIAFVNYITQMLLALIVVSNLVILFTKASASAARVNELLALPAEEGVPPNAPSGAAGGKAMEAGKRAIEFEGVSFGYGGGMALDNISFSMDWGETLGIIGGTGSGKSTLLSLIAGFYGPTAGRILVAGRPVADYSAEELAALVGIALQRSILFTATVAENIALGSPGAGEAEVRAAAVTAQADDFISRLPQGYSSLVERGGVNFSGGQRQRINVARAIVKKPAILLLDDVSSALDYSTDAALRAALRAERREGATVIVSQRVSAITDADRILVLDGGKLVGEGRHEELAANCAAYRDILASQA
jgi:ATP-binding cassette subfamily B protein